MAEHHARPIRRGEPLGMPNVPSAPEWTSTEWAEYARLRNENGILRTALARAEQDGDYCYVCDMHPSTGHADLCPLHPNAS